MLFGKKDKKPSDRVLDLKARVDALRAADEASREKPYSLEHFLEGDDVLTGRKLEDDYTPQGFDAGASRDAGIPADAESHFEVNLQAELEKYLQRQEALDRGSEAGGATGAPATPSRPETQSWSVDDGRGRGGDPLGSGDLLGSTADSPRDVSSSWPAEDTGWSVPGSTPPMPADDPAPPAWPESQWPAEDDWPADQKAI